jgi:hypothetical protein
MTDMKGHMLLLLGHHCLCANVRMVKVQSCHINELDRVRPKNEYLVPELLHIYTFYLIQFDVIEELGKPSQIVGVSSGTTVNMLKIDGLESPKY